jgi:hypothetical protein
MKSMSEGAGGPLTAAATVDPSAPAAPLVRDALL